MKITLIVIGKQKASPALDMCKEYVKRIKWPVKIEEIDAPKGNSKSKEAELSLRQIPQNSFVVALDERGKSLSSNDFSEYINATKTKMDNRMQTIQNKLTQQNKSKIEEKIQ